MGNNDQNKKWSGDLADYVNRIVKQEIASAMQKKNQNAVLSQDDMYYEIEYDATPMPGVGKFVLKSQKIKAPEKDEVRECFDRMRDIARDNRFLTFGNSKFYNKRVQQENSRIFYKQGMFMKDFEDEYAEFVPYKAYFPYYQMMGYGQLRTYFTWRTQVRNGHVKETSLSYAYLYLYELLSNIGVASPQEGLERLMSFWNAFRMFDSSIDKYVLRWLKDYHIYYDLPQSFAEFVVEHDLTMHYPNLAASDDAFALLCAVSKYDIQKSVFYREGNESLIRDCVQFTVDRLTSLLAGHSIALEHMLFPPVKATSVWTPFSDALFYPWRQQRDRRVVLSAKEIYICSKNQWTFQTALAAESGRQLAGYILKQTEAVLRQLTNYKYKITAGIGTVHPGTVMRLQNAGVSLEASITNAVTEFYREATKTVVSVDKESLAKIRREAMLTQERLLVPEEDEVWPVSVAAGQALADVRARQETAPSTVPQEPEETNPWNILGQMLTQTERNALRFVLQGNPDIRPFADAHGIMAEVLLDGINEKAMDAVGDSLLDDECAIYEDYIEQVRQIIEE